MIDLLVGMCTHCGCTRFKLLRDNFLTPDRVMMKETTVTTLPVQHLMWPHCVELNSADPEFTLLQALQSVCWSIIPHEPLPDLLLDSLRNLHLLFETSYSIDDRSTESADPWIPLTWPKEKIRMAVQIFPYLLELMAAAASGLESIEAAPSSSHELIDKASSAPQFSKQKSKLLHQFARAMRFDMVHMINRCDEAMLYKFAHHIFQFYLMRSDLPAEFIELVRDLLTLAPEFRMLFLKNQGANLLWKALHTGDRFQLGSSKLVDISPLAQAILTANVTAAPKTPHERRTSLFGLSKKTQATRTRKSVDFGTTFAIPVVTSTKPLVFLRINPFLVQTELIAKLCRGQLEVAPDKVEVNSVGARYAFCYCREIHRQRSDLSTSESRGDTAKKCQQRFGIYSSCKRKKRSELSPKMCMYELVLQLSLEFLFSSSVKSWDRDVGLLLRLENIHGSFSNEVMQQMKDAAAEVPKDMIVLSPSDVLVEQRDYCRLRVVISCISNLYRLEFKRRNQGKLALGDKKYWGMIHLLRSELREFNDYLESYAETNDDDDSNDDSEKADSTDEISKSPSSARRTELLCHIAMFRWIPKLLLDEWIVLSLEDFLQTAGILNMLLERAEASDSTGFEHIQYACQLLRIFTLIMTRSTDADLQSLILRVLNHGASQIPSLLQRISAAALKCVDKGTSNGFQTEILALLHAFVALDLTVSAKGQRAQRNPSAYTTNPDDAEALEQRKAVLMADILTSRSGAEQEGPTLWEYTVLALVPKEVIPPSDSAARFTTGNNPMLGVIASCQQREEPSVLSTLKADNFKPVESFLLVLAQFYSSLVPDSPHAHIRFEACVDHHIHYITVYAKRYNSCDSQDTPKLLRRAAELHLKCLVALGNRRAQFSTITEAFDSQRVLPQLFQLMKDMTAAEWSHLEHHDTTVYTEATHLTNRLKLGTQSSESAGGIIPLCPGEVCEPEQPLVSGLSLNLNNIRKSLPHLDPLPTAGASATKRSLFQHPNVHALAVILIASYMILEPNFELDDKLCPRFAISRESSSTTTDDLTDILYDFQQHLASVKLSMKAYEAMIRDMKGSYVIPTAARVSAIRTLIRLAAPSFVDRAIYVQEKIDPAGLSESQTSNEQASGTSATRTAVSCTYVTKGAFSTVYCSTPMLPQAGKVAIKVLEHQKRPGDLSILHDLYNEVTVLKRLQGEPAAVQMLDFGNHQAAQDFEAMMEFCPCTLTEWRASLQAVPFRSLLVMVLRAFEYTCQSLSRIHREGVGHFDVKVRMSECVVRNW